MTHYQPPPRIPTRIPRTRAELEAEDKLRRDRISAGMRGGNVLADLWIIVKFVVSLPWRVFRWIQRRVAREERAGGEDA